MEGHSCYTSWWFRRLFLTAMQYLALHFSPALCNAATAISYGELGGAIAGQGGDSCSDTPAAFCFMAEQRHGSPFASMLGRGAGTSSPPSTVMPAPASPSKMPAASASPSLTCRCTPDCLSHGKPRSKVEWQHCSGVPIP